MRKQYAVSVEFFIQMDDTRPEEAAEAVTARVNEMLAVLERKDDIRVVLLNQLEVKEQL